jgi:hypothetical protein
MECINVKTFLKHIKIFLLSKKSLLLYCYRKGNGSSLKMRIHSTYRAMSYFLYLFF